MGTLKSKAKVWLSTSNWQPSADEFSLEDAEPRPRGGRHFQQQTPSRLNWYVLAQYMFTVFAVALFLFQESGLKPLATAIAISMLLFMVFNGHFLLNRRRWSFLLEFFRHIVLLLFICFIAEGTTWFNTAFFVAAALAFLSLFWISTMSHLFKR